MLKWGGGMIRAFTLILLVDIVILNFHIGRKCGVLSVLNPLFVTFND